MTIAVNRIFPVTGLLDLLCPPICPVCSGVIEDSVEPFCSACVQKIVTPVGQFCLRCGGRRFVSPISSSTDGCARCRTTRFRFERVIALGEYKSDLRMLVLRMKTDRTGILAISIARMLVASRRAELENVQADYVVPVPMHPLRREDRGVNSPDLLAEELARQLKVPFARHLLRRVRCTDLQYTLSNQARAENVSDAFALRPPSLWQRLLSIGNSIGSTVVNSIGNSITSTITNRKQRGTTKKVRERSPAQLPALSGKNIILVDDIFTTGATCNEITKVLLSAGARSVTVAAPARAEGVQR